MQTKHPLTSQPVVSEKVPKAKLAEPKSTKELVKESDADAFYFRALENKHIYLNEQQVKAVRQTDGPLLVLAGAGSGKTSVLTARAGYLLSVQKVRAERILLLTFTKKAAGELKDRLGLLPGVSKHSLRSMAVGTFHSIFLKLLYQHGYEHMKLLTSEKQKQVAVKMILKDMALKEEYDVETLLAQFSYYKNMMKSPEDLPAASSVEKEVKTIYQRYEEYKQSRNLLDFDDILYEVYKLLKENEEIRSKLQERFQYILVDEFQDSNLVQYEVLKMLAPPSQHIMAVGDDDQTIYQFRGSHHRLILDFPKEFPGTKIVTLITNYRSNPYIVGLGNDIIKHNQQRHDKTLLAVHTRGVAPRFFRPDTTVEEATCILDVIQSQVASGKRKYRDFAVIYRTHAVSRALMDQLVWKDIPFILHSQKQVFYENGLVKPILDCLRLAFYPDDLDALAGILPTLYLSKEKVLNEVIDQRFTDRMRGVEKPALAYLLDLSKLPSYQKERIAEKVSAIQSLKHLSPAEAIRKIREGNDGYDKYLQDNHRKTFTLQKELVQETLDELYDSAKPFKDSAKYLAFIDRIIKKQQENGLKNHIDQEDAIRLTTVHGAKGLEFPCVFLIGTSDGIIPHNSSLEAAEDRMSDQQNKKAKIAEAIEEERRLLYVGVSRAMEELYVSSPRFFRSKPLPMTRFLKEVYESKKTSD
ncbi:DNA helicase-2/ATP-dependent DNA helicase PcrA [Bacillus ectoiniformans]|uniref:ATP-dependent helicase n=1 Tax=Bacillus ectoiniformans TaxID=1494429 RepID=UPI001EF88E81|nr:ATP-dependent helicase [Bacillus ectoiniformans]MBM7647724.1 DNA helicase-2/ATP-dependent DNA helicase PcrA [Bacillus ectoiniformans]